MKAYHFCMLFFNEVTRIAKPVIGVFTVPNEDALEGFKLEVLKSNLCAGFVAEGFRFMSFTCQLIPESIAPMNREDEPCIKD